MHHSQNSAYASLCLEHLLKGGSQPVEEDRFSVSRSTAHGYAELKTVHSRSWAMAMICSKLVVHVWKQRSLFVQST
jgi:hypothetical protein